MLEPFSTGKSQMLPLHELERQFAASMLFEQDGAICSHIVEDGFSAAQRLRIYRNTFRSTLTQALRMTYPAVDRLVGRDFFDTAAEQFIHGEPPSSAYLNDYGEGFAAFLDEFEPARALRYLPDVARFEWALSIAANAADAPVLHAEALARVDAAQHAALRFEPHPSVRLLVLDYPADEIADAVMSGDDAALAEVVVANGPVWLIVSRGPNGVEAQRVEAHVYAFVSRLCDGEPLGRLLESLAPECLSPGAPAHAPAVIAEQLTRGRLTAFRTDERTST